MDFIRLGRTNERVSVAGLGCGGHSRLGMARGASTEDAAKIVRRALDLGITFIDTAMVYGTEEAVGLGVEGRRDEVFISTKTLVGRPRGEAGGEFLSAEALRANLEASLKRLKTDHVDAYHLHGIMPFQYEHCAKVLVPELKRLQEEGKIRFLAISEVFVADTSHQMFQRALPDNLFDVIMVGLNLLNPSARKTVFPLTQKNDVGTLIMFAVRRALNSPANTREAIEDLLKRGAIDASTIDKGDPLGFLVAHRDVESVVQAAYRFCRYEPGAHVILTGTGNAAHLEENVRSILAPPLPAELQERLRAIFGEVDSVSGN